MYVIKGGNCRYSPINKENSVIFTHPHVAPNKFDFLLSVEDKKRNFLFTLSLVPMANEAFKLRKGC